MPGLKKTASSLPAAEWYGSPDLVKPYLPPDRDHMLLEEMLKTDDLYNKKEDQVWNELTFKYFRLSVSSMLMDESVAKKYLRGTWEFKPWESSLPYSQLFTGTYRDAMRSIGGIIEPEIKLKIEF